MNIVTLNVKGLRGEFKRKNMFRKMKNLYGDSIIFLQETHSLQADEEIWKQDWGGDIIFDHHKNDSCGVCILFPCGFYYKTKQVIKGENGRLLINEISFNEDTFVLCNIYAPTKSNESDQCRFLDTLIDKLEAFKAENIVVGGDFNITLNPVLDKNGGAAEKNSNYRNKLLNFIEDFQLNDIWRTKHPTTKQYTWLSSDNKIKSRLDFWLISEFLVPQVSKVTISCNIMSDHRNVSLSMQGNLFQKRGPGFWKFNNSLLYFI